MPAVTVPDVARREAPPLADQAENELLTLVRAELVRGCTTLLDLSVDPRPCLGRKRGLTRQQQLYQALGVLIIHRVSPQGRSPEAARGSFHLAR